MTTILILHSSTDGQTKKICRSIANHIQKKVPHALILQKAVGGCTLKDMQHSDIILLGAGIRYGKHSNAVYQFVEQYRDQLDAKISCFFSVNLTARKAGKNTATSNPYVIKFLAQTTWQPNEVDVFAGKIDYARYGFFYKLMMQCMMWLSKSPTHSNQPIEFTDWKQVKAFTKRIMSYIKIDDARPEPNATTQNQPELAKNILKNSELAQTENANQSKSASESVYKNESHFASQITAQSTLDNLLIVCGHCGTTNRIPSSKLAEKPSCGQCKQPVFSEQPITLDSNISKHTQTNQVLTIVDFWASWCQPCHQMAPQFANASRQLPQVVFAKLQTDKYEHASTPYHIRSLPTLVAFKNGVEISRQSGVMSTGQIVQWVKHLG